MAVLRSPHYNFVIMKTNVPICGRDIWIIWMTRSSHVQKWGGVAFLAPWVKAACGPFDDLKERLGLRVKHKGEKCTCTKSLQSCPTLCDVMDCSPPGSSVHGILQARILEWLAMPFSRGSFQPRDRTWVSCIAGRFFTIWATRQAPTRQASPNQTGKRRSNHEGPWRTW